MSVFLRNRHIRYVTGIDVNSIFEILRCRCRETLLGAFRYALRFTRLFNGGRLFCAVFRLSGRRQAGRRIFSIRSDTTVIKNRLARIKGTSSVFRGIIALVSSFIPFVGGIIRIIGKISRHIRYVSRYISGSCGIVCVTGNISQYINCVSSCIPGVCGNAGVIRKYVLLNGHDRVFIPGTFFSAVGNDFRYGR